MEEDWSVQTCDVKLRNLSKVDGYKVLIPLLLKEMETQSRVPNPFWDSSSASDDASSVELDSDDEVPPFMNNSFVNNTENDNVDDTKGEFNNKNLSPVSTLGSFEDVLNSIKSSPPKKSVNSRIDKDSADNSANISEENTVDGKSSIVLEEIVNDEPSEGCSEDCVDIVSEKDSVVPDVLESVKNMDRASSCSSSDIMEITPDLIFPDSDTDDTETIHGKSEDSYPSTNSSEHPSTLERRWKDVDVRKTKWELDTESDKFVEVGSSLSGIKLKKMAVLVKEEHDFNRILATGPVKTRVKMRNVRKQLGLLDKPMLESIIVERRSESTHPLICPFFCPIYNVPCEAMFKVNEREFFIEHVTKGNCPYAPRHDPFAAVEPVVKCDKCGDEIQESKLKEHMDENHLTHTCPGCKGKFECKMDVEDHIINEHATHFMSNLIKVYRRAPKEPPSMFKPPEYQDDLVETFEPDPQAPPQPYIGHTYDGRIHPEAPPQPIPTNTVRLIEPKQSQMARQIVKPHPKYLKPSGGTGGVSKGNIQIIHQQPITLPHNAAGPRLVFVQQQQQQPGMMGASTNNVWMPPGQRMMVNNGQVKTYGGKILQVTPGLAGNLARVQPSFPLSVPGNQTSNTITVRSQAPTQAAGNFVPTPIPMVMGNTPPTPIVLGSTAVGSKAKLQQVKLPSGQLVWAQPTASEPIPGTDKAKIQFKVIGPVKPTQPQQIPGVMQLSHHNSNAPVVPRYSGPGPTSVPAQTSSSSILYRQIAPNYSKPVAQGPKNFVPVKPMRLVQPLRLLHVDNDGAPVYQHNGHGHQPSNIPVDRDGAPVKQNIATNSILNSMLNSGFGSDASMLSSIKQNSMKLVPQNQILKRSGDHEYSAVAPSEEEGVDPLEGLDPYDTEEGVDPLAGEDDKNPPVVLLDDCPDVPDGDDDIIDISNLCQASVEG